MKRLMLLLTLVLGQSLHARPAHARSAQDAYEAGVSALRSGDHDAAVTALAEAVETGGRHPAAYHALGNALYRSEARGHATAAWRRAAALAPRDGDIEANLDRAHRESVDRIDASSTSGWSWHRLLAPFEAALLAGVLVALGLAAAAIRTHRSRRTGRGTGFGTESLVLVGLGVLFAGSVAVSAGRPAGAVVVADAASARSTPGAGGVELFVLHTGAEVVLLEESGTHALVSLPDERKGWLPLEALVSTDPAAPFPLPAPRGAGTTPAK